MVHAIIGILGGPQYESLIFLREKGLAFSDAGGDRSICGWGEIKHICHLDRYNDLKVIDKEGSVFLGHALADKRFADPTEKIAQMWTMWRSKISDADQMNTFISPDSASEKEPVNARSILLGGPVLKTLVLLFLFMSIIDPRVFLLVVLVLACHLWVAIPRLLQRRKASLLQIRLSEHHLELVYDDASIRAFNIEDITYHSLEDPHDVGIIVFADGTSLKNLDRLSYWVVLRDRLLSTLERQTD